MSNKMNRRSPAVHSAATPMNKYPPDADAAGGSGAQRAAFQQLAAAAPPASLSPHTAYPLLPLDTLLRLSFGFKRTRRQNTPAVF